MKRTFGALCLSTALALGATASAQQPGANQPARNDGVTTPADYEQTNTKNPAAEGSITLTGCVDRANDGTYELKNARNESAATGGAASASTPTGTSGTATGTTGTTGTNSTGATGNGMPSTWVLKSTTDLAPHVGHQVQITGRTSSSSTTASNTPDATTSSQTTTTTSAKMKDAGQKVSSVDVQSVRMISSSCS
jgi:hypothetical protein